MQTLGEDDNFIKVNGSTKTIYSIWSDSKIASKRKNKFMQIFSPYQVQTQFPY